MWNIDSIIVNSMEELAHTKVVEFELQETQKNMFPGGQAQ